MWFATPTIVPARPRFHVPTFLRAQTPADSLCAGRKGAWLGLAVNAGIRSRLATSRAIAALFALPSFPDGAGIVQTGCRCRVVRWLSEMTLVFGPSMGRGTPP